MTGGCPSRGLKSPGGLGKATQSHVLSARPAQPSRQGRRNCCIEARAVPAGMGVWATKAGMTSIFTPEGLCLPATVLALEEGNIVTQVPTTGLWMTAQHILIPEPGCHPCIPLGFGT